MTNKLLRRPEVEAVVRLSRSRIYQLMQDGKFPLPVRLGPNSVAWRALDIEEWIAELPVANELRGGARTTAGVTRVSEAAAGRGVGGLGARDAVQALGGS